MRTGCCSRPEKRALTVVANRNGAVFSEWRMSSEQYGKREITALCH